MTTTSARGITGMTRQLQDVDISKRTFPRTKRKIIDNFACESGVTWVLTQWGTLAAKQGVHDELHKSLNFAAVYEFSFPVWSLKELCHAAGMCFGCDNICQNSIVFHCK